LLLLCRQCGHGNVPGSNFCANCGTPLAGERAPASTAAGELPATPLGSADRRQVTVMFCDLVGSTALSARLDPEDMREIVGVYYRKVAETVHHFDGYVAQYYGDGVLVYFGYPHAHEQDAEMAVRAGLDLVAVITALPSPVPLQTRIGIATGLVVAGDLFKTGEARGHNIVGETPNLAARLQGLVGPNTVVIDEGTRRLIGDIFELHDLGAKFLKGITGSARAWKVLRASSIESRFEAFHAMGLTPLVGREEEAELLLRRWSKAKNGEGQVALLSGEAGIGKSRLTAELSHRVADEPHARLRYFCSAQHTASALHPIIGHMERAAVFAHDDAPRARLDKLDALLERTSTAVQERALFAELLSIANDGRYPALALSPRQRRQRTLDALLSQIAALARSTPLLMTLEDAHWIDPTSLELFGRAVDRIASMRALLIVTFRPEFEAPWVGRPHVTTLALNRLGQPEIGAMIDRVIGNKPLPTSVRRDLIERTDGIPLFIEEMTKAVLEAAVSAAEHAIAAIPSPTSTVPSSLYATLTARLDRLGPSKEVVEMAAAIGRQVSHQLLAAVVRQPEAALEAALDRLVAAGLMMRQGLPPHATYRFKHALMQDAAYSMLLRPRREALHARIAEVYEREFQEIVEAQPEMLAHHLALAGFTERAIVFLLKAARTAIANGAVAEAVTQLRRALALVGNVGDQSVRQRHEIELQIALGNALMALRGYSAEETDAAFRRARELCLEAGDRTQLLRVLWGQFTGDFASGRERASLTFAEELLKLSERLEDSGGRQMGHASVGASLLHLGSFGEALVQFEHALAIGTVNQREWAFRYGQSGSVVAHSYLSLDLLLLGFPEQAGRHAEQSIAEAKVLSHPPSLCFAHSIASRFYYLRGDKKRLAEHSVMVACLADEHGLGLWQALGGIYVGWSRGESGATDEAIDLLRTGMAKYRAIGAGLSMPLYLLSLAKIQARVGDHQEALRLIGEAGAVIDGGEEGWLSAEIHRLVGETALLLPQADAVKAQTHFERALAIAREQRARFWELRAATSLARLWRDQGKPQQARDLLAPVCSWFSEGFDHIDFLQAKSLLDGGAA
jgi:class 3 adenylate cyclase/predicted ATPase